MVKNVVVRGGISLGQNGAYFTNPLYDSQFQLEKLDTIIWTNEDFMATLANPNGKNSENLGGFADVNNPTLARVIQNVHNKILEVQIGGIFRDKDFEMVARELGVEVLNEDNAIYSFSDFPLNFEFRYYNSRIGSAESLESFNYNAKNVEFSASAWDENRKGIRYLLERRSMGGGTGTGPEGK